MGVAIGGCAHKFLDLIGTMGLATGHKAMLKDP